MEQQAAVINLVKEERHDLLVASPAATAAMDMMLVDENESYALRVAKRMKLQKVLKTPTLTNLIMSKGTSTCLPARVVVLSNSTHNH